MSRTTTLKSLFFVLCASIAVAALPNQPRIAAPDPGFDFGPFSTVDTTAIPQPDILRATAYDNFTIDADYILSGITWSGIYETVLPTVPSDTDFIINIFGDDAGVPDVDAGTLYSWTIEGGVAGVSDGDVMSAANGLFSPVTATSLGDGPGYDYMANIDATLSADTYWVSIVADQRFSNTVDLDPEWQWMQGDGPDDGFYAFDAQLDPMGTPESGLFSAGKDLAFELKGTLVPEPASALLGLMGFMALGMLRKRR